MIPHSRRLTNAIWCAAASGLGGRQAVILFVEGEGQGNKQQEGTDHTNQEKQRRHCC